MDLKNKLLKNLEEADDFVSGEALAKKFGITRSGVWKAIKILEKEGYDIIGIRKKGYFLKKYGDKLDKKVILEAYRGPFSIEVECHDVLQSTNDYLKKLAEDGASEWHVVLAERQTRGKGRLGRRFYSPKGYGIYLSILLRPKIPLKEASLLTIFAASIVGQTIESMLQQSVEIKWVNDIFLNQKKVSGILTEASLSLENDSIDYVILGIGINVSRGRNLPDDLKDVFGSLFKEAPETFRNQFVGELLSRLTIDYQDFTKKLYMDFYRERSMVTGKEVYLLTSKEREKVFVKAIDDNGCLVIIDNKGEERIVNTGEVSLRFE